MGGGGGGERNLHDFFAFPTYQVVFWNAWNVFYTVAQYTKMGQGRFVQEGTWFVQEGTRSVYDSAKFCWLYACGQHFPRHPIKTTLILRLCFYLYHLLLNFHARCLLSLHWLCFLLIRYSIWWSTALLLDLLLIRVDLYNTTRPEHQRIIIDLILNKYLETVKERANICS